MSEVNQVASFKRGAQLRILQPSAEDDPLYVVLVSHFKTAIEGAFVNETITQNGGDAYRTRYIRSPGS
jgi:hypothetical protein